MQLRCARSAGADAFYGCGNLTGVTIPSSVTSIGNAAFIWCRSLTNVILPGSLTTIGDGAFNFCDHLNSITIPNSVTSIGNSAFNECTSLASVSIPRSVTSIGENAFLDCASLTNVIILGSVVSLEGTFAFCTRLTSVSLPGSLTSIGDNTFNDCTSLTNITIPSGVDSIGSFAFEWCSSLKSAYFQGNAPSFFGSSVFESAASGFTIYYPSTFSGWTTPTWNGYPAQPYDYKPTGKRPALTLVLGPGPPNLVLSWPTNFTGFTLQSATNLVSSHWTANLPDPVVVNGQYTVTNPISSSQRFFRLSQ